MIVLRPCRRSDCREIYIKVLPPSDILNLVFSLGPFWLLFPPAPPNFNVGPNNVFVLFVLFLLFGGRVLGPHAPTINIEIRGVGGTQQHDKHTKLRISHC